MFAIALFAMIGAMLTAGAWYWILFGFYCFFWACSKIVQLGERIEENEKNKAAKKPVLGKTKSFDPESGKYTIELTEEGRKFFKMDK